MRPTRHSSGFTLIELMITLAVVAILTSIALPSYNAYVQRSRLPVALDALGAYASRMEQNYQDTGRYGTGTTCAASLPTAKDFTISCVLTEGSVSSDQVFTATATGSGPVAGYAFTITSKGVRATTSHPKGTNSTCWTLKGGTQCDT